MTLNCKAAYQKFRFAEFLELPNGIPDSDTFRRVFERINPSELSACLTDRISVECNKRAVVAIDGKTICGSGNHQHKAYHVVSAFVAENQITLGEMNVGEKTNEITADAMSCQKKIVEKIIEGKAEDKARARKDHSPLNLNVLRKTALALVSQTQYGRMSKKPLMFKARLIPVFC